ETPDGTPARTFVRKTAPSESTVVRETAPSAASGPDVVAHLPRPLRGRVEFEHVRFSYTPEKPLITDLNFVAEPGQTVAIVGPTGAGKTT
ncbi:ABC transporter ATP-binding protein, partial [Xanthomonas citri pv. citri]|nr:ABC transporter ATP-binding protein [Xanthomonas citri pv. citri]